MENFFGKNTIILWFVSFILLTIFTELFIKNMKIPKFTKKATIHLLIDCIYIKNRLESRKFFEKHCSYQMNDKDVYIFDHKNFMDIF